MVSLLALVTSAYALDPLQNGGFESGDLTGWTFWGDETAAVAGEAYEGSYTARLTLAPTETGFQQTGLYQDMANAVSGEHLLFTVRARVPTTDPVTLDGHLILKWESGEVSDEVVVPLATDATWTEATLDVVTPEGVTWLRYVLLFEANEGGADGTVFIDGLHIVTDVIDTDEPVDTDDLSDTDDTSETGGNEDSGCGCDHAAAPSLFTPLVLLALAARRRRAASV